VSLVVGLTRTGKRASNAGEEGGKKREREKEGWRRGGKRMEME
jgi:hypothetical protein